MSEICALVENAGDTAGQLELIAALETELGKAHTALEIELG